MSQRENLHASDQSLGTPNPESLDTTLKRGALRLLGVVFVAESAPEAGMYVAVGIILLIFSVGHATMSQHVTNTVVFFAYVGLGLSTRRR